MLKKIICCVIYLFLLFIVMYGTMNFVSDNHNSKQTKVPVQFRVIDVLEYKKIDNKTRIKKLLVQLNEHMYVMIQRSNDDNVVFEHYNECNYCFNQGIHDYRNFSFSIYDNLDTKLMGKLNIK